MLKPNFRAYLSVINTMTELHFAETVVPKQLSSKSRFAFVLIQRPLDLAYLSYSVTARHRQKHHRPPSYRALLLHLPL